MIPKYLALDVESGGLDHNVTSVLEYYFIVLSEEFEEIGSLHLLTKPDNGIYVLTAGGMDCNKIDLVKHDKVAILEREAKKLLYDFLSKNTEDGKHKLIWLGHNVAFDRDAVYSKLLTRKTCDKFCKYYTLDTGTISQFLRVVGVIPDEVKGSLGALIEFFGVDGVNSHKAEDDIRATIKVLKVMRDCVYFGGHVTYGK